MECGFTLKRVRGMTRTYTYVFVAGHVHKHQARLKAFQENAKKVYCE